MQRKLSAIVLAAALSATAGGVFAQDFVFGWNPRSGDAWVDTRLSDINQYGYRYRDPFIDEMTRYYGAPRDLVSDLLINRRWAPGDIYYACALAQVVGQPCRNVVNEWDRDHGQGWGVIAQRMGIKPGSAEFHRLKKGFVPTYDRWGRPIAIDDDLRIEFPNRGKGPKGTALVDRPGNSGGNHGNGRGRDNDNGNGNGNGHAKKSDHGNQGHGKSSHGNQDKGNNGKGKSGSKGSPDKGKGHGKG
jgi:hypothetical protein